MTEASEFFFYLAQQPNSDLGRLVEVSRPHAIGHTQTVSLFWTSEWLVAEVATYTTHNKDNRRTFVPSAGLEPATALSPEPARPSMLIQQIVTYRFPARSVSRIVANSYWDVRGFSQYFQADARIAGLLRLGQDCHFPNALQFVAHRSSLCLSVRQFEVLEMW